MNMDIKHAANRITLVIQVTKKPQQQREKSKQIDAFLHSKMHQSNGYLYIDCDMAKLSMLKRK